MRVLLDTQAFLWYSAGDPRLSSLARSVIEDGNNDRVLSIASLWEIAIKHSLGKLNLSDPYEQFVAEAMDRMRCNILHIAIAHLDRLIALPYHHQDPFDRLMIAQSLVEGIETVSVDDAWDAYGAKRNW